MFPEAAVKINFLAFTHTHTQAHFYTHVHTFTCSTGMHNLLLHTYIQASTKWHVSIGRPYDCSLSSLVTKQSRPPTQIHHDQMCFSLL